MEGMKKERKIRLPSLTLNELSFAITNIAEGR